LDSIIGFIGLFDRTRDNTLQFTVKHAQTSVHRHIFTSRCLVAASTADVRLSLGSRTVRCLDYQLLTATAHHGWTPALL
jgi:hypothetical protein